MKLEGKSLLKVIVIGGIAISLGTTNVLADDVDPNLVLTQNQEQVQVIEQNIEANQSIETEAMPTVIPTVEPTPEPTTEPSVAPTVEPTQTVEPTAMPTQEPIPTAEPTVIPTVEITPEPTQFIPKDINSLAREVDTSIHTYTGGERNAALKIFDGDVQLVKDVDYTATYINNVEVGKAELTIQGIGKYTGTIVENYFIAPKRAVITSVTMNSNFDRATIEWEFDERADGYRIYMAESEKGKYTRIKTVENGSITKYTKKGLDPNKTYYFKIRAYKTIEGQRICKKYSTPKTGAQDGLIADVTLNSPNSSASRNHNLSLASQKISGTILRPGDTFNWFRVVGPASASRGYKKAIVYQNGKNVMGYGGGVCQVSTTLYQAARNAGLRIVERHIHSKAVSYTTRGNDATVSYGVQNLRFQNNQNYSIRIVTSSNGGKTTCKLYRIN